MPPAQVGEVSQELRDFSYTALGRGYDRALDTERDDCFDRDRSIVTPVNLWEAAGFTAFRDYEISSKSKTAVKVGVKIENVDLSFGAQTASLVGSSGESSYYVMLARFTSRVEAAGQITGANSACENMPNNSSNGVEDFVSLCGDRFLDRKVYGGHVMISWRRKTSDLKKDTDFGLNFGAKATNASVEAEVAFSNLFSLGYGQEEVFIESSGLPFPPTPETLPSGQVAFTIKSALDYLKDVSQAANQGGSFARVIGYSMERQTVPHMDICLGQTGRNTSMSDTEWVCMYDTLTELAENRDGSGDREFLADEYERHRLAAESYLPDNRLVFNTVPQSRCQTDDDGDPDLERSGKCQIEALTAFVNFYKKCQDSSSLMLMKCRSNVLGTVDKCVDFSADCALPFATLSDGTVVACDEAGLNASLAEVIPYTVNPPFMGPPPGAHFSPPLVLEFTETPARPIPGVSPATHMCGITGVRGGLHESTTWVAPTTANDWTVKVQSAVPDRDKAVSVTVTCVNLENFVYVNGYADTPILPTSETVVVPALNGGPNPYRGVLGNPGNTSLLGWTTYLSEPQTSLMVTDPTATGFGDYLGFDLFPFESPNAMIGTFSVLAKPSSTGLAGGSIAYPFGQKTVGLSHSNRQPLFVSASLADDSFCYLTGLKGSFFNINDSVGISTSDGMTTLISFTPLAKDRNPGAQVQCILFDRL